jgi:nucleoside-diphosphate-sugar epimerase
VTILVTGATGFIGWHLARHLVDRGHHVRALVRRHGERLASAGVELAWADLTDPQAVRAAVEGTKIVFHLAAQRDAWGTPESTYHQVNVKGTRHLLAAAAESGVQRFLFCSSVGVARYPGNLQADETLPYVEASSQIVYHRTKAQAEQEVLASARAGKVPALVVRPVITYGPGDRTGMVTQLLTRLAQGQFLPVGSGSNHVDLAYIDDMVTGITLAGKQGTIGQTYILSGPQPVRMRQVLAAAYAALGRTGPGQIYVPVRLAYFLAGWAERMWGTFNQRPPITRDAVATLTVDRGFSHIRASRELGYQPRVHCPEGLRRTWAWLREPGEPVQRRGDSDG